MSAPTGSARPLAFAIEGMDCASCAATLRKAISGLPGASEVEVSLARARMTLALDETRTDVEKLRRTVASLGYSASAPQAIADAPPHLTGAGCGCGGHAGDAPSGNDAFCQGNHGHAHDRHEHAHDQHSHDHGHDHHAHDNACCSDDKAEDAAPAAGQTVLGVSGMDCASCAATIRTALEGMEGVSDVRVSLAREQVALTLAPGAAGTAAIGDTIRRLGYTPTEPDAERADSAWWQQPRVRHLGLALALTALAWVLAHAAPALAPWAFAAATLIPLAPIARRAFVAARLGAVFTIQTLMTVAALGAIVIGAQQEAAVVVLLFILGELLEGVAADRARSGIRALGELLPREALVADGGTTRTVPAASLKIGQIVLTRPGDRIAADGVVTEGISSVDESPVTGESVPVTKQPGDRLSAGTVNHDAALRLRVDRAPEDNTIARIIALVEEAQDSRAPTERFIDRFSRLYMPAVLVIAALVAVLPPLALGGDWQTWIYRGLALLLIGCPCALVISVPAAVASALAAGARQGMLVKGGAVIERLATASRVVFDKTGTLTLGRPRVTDVVVLEGTEPALLAAAAAVERESSHPLAAAIARHAEGVERLPAEAVRVVPGKGMEGRVAGRATFIGAPRHAADRAAPSAEAQARIAALEAEGKTVAVVVSGGRTLGLIALRDEPRADARGAVATLARRGIGAVMMTGDNARTGAAIGDQIGLAVEAGLLPEDKATRVGALAQTETVVMVGDGVNDAPALAAASVGVAVGSGTDVAMEAADAALMRDRIDDVPRLIGLSRATMTNIRQNVAIALGLKAIFLVTTVTGFTGLWLAVFADTGATVLVTLNAMRLLGHFRGDRAPEAAPDAALAPAE